MNTSKTALIVILALAHPCYASASTGISESELFKTLSANVRDHDSIRAIEKTLNANGFSKASAGSPTAGMLVFSQKTRLVWGAEPSKTHDSDCFVQSNKQGPFYGSQATPTYCVFNGNVSLSPLAWQTHPTFVVFQERKVFVVDNLSRRFFVLDRRKGP